MQKLKRELRKSAEENGYALTDQEFERLYEHTVRKTEIIGKEEDYIPLLFKDVVHEYYFSIATLAMEVMRTTV